MSIEAPQGFIEGVHTAAISGLEAQEEPGVNATPLRNRHVGATNMCGEKRGKLSEMGILHGLNMEIFHYAVNGYFPFG